MSKPIAGHVAPVIGGNKSDLVKVVKDLSDKVNQIPAAPVADENGNILASFDDYTYNESRIIFSATQPTNLNMTTDVGMLWIDTSTNPDTVKWWDGFQFWDYLDGQNWQGSVSVSAIAPSMLANGQTSIRLYKQADAPGSPSLHWFWLDTDTNIVRYWDGSTWVIAADSVLTNAVTVVLNISSNNLTDGYITLYCQNSAPGSQNTTTDVGNLWYDADNGLAGNRWTGDTWTSFNGSVVTNAPDTDGSAPIVAPTLTVRAGFGSYFLSWEPVANNDFVTYKVYMSTSSSVVKGTTTYLGDSTSTFFYTNETPAGAALVDGVTYYFAVLASDPDGDGPMSATVGDVVKQKIVRTQITDGAIDTPQLNANAVTASIIASDAVQTAELYSDAITAKHSIIGAWIATAAGGERVIMRNDGSGGTIEFYAGLSGESPGRLDPYVYGGSLPAINLVSGTTGSFPYEASILLYSGDTSGGRGIIMSGSTDIVGTLMADEITSQGAFTAYDYLQGLSSGGVSGSWSVGSGLSVSGYTSLQSVDIFGTLGVSSDATFGGVLHAFRLETDVSVTTQFGNTYMDASGRLFQSNRSISTGASDSGGTGYRLLRVPN